jgi:hypothetical protein
VESQTICASKIEEVQDLKLQVSSLTDEVKQLILEVLMLYNIGNYQMHTLDCLLFPEI